MGNALIIGDSYCNSCNKFVNYKHNYVLSSGVSIAPK